MVSPLEIIEEDEGERFLWYSRDLSNVQTFKGKLPLWPVQLLRLIRSDLDVVLCSDDSDVAVLFRIELKTLPDVPACGSRA